MKWLRKIFGLCEHHYEIIEQIILRRDGLIHGKVYVQKCRHCGKLHNHVVDITDY